MFREVVIAPEIRQDPSLLDPIEKATKRLQFRIGDYAKPISISWEKIRDEQNPATVRATMIDHKGEVHADYERKDVNPLRLRRRLNRLYRNLLSNRSDHLLEELRELMSARNDA